MSTYTDHQQRMLDQATGAEMDRVAERHAFLNRIRSLYNIDHDRLPELTDEQWPEFRDDPPHYLIHTDKVQVDAIMREVEARQRR